MTVYPQEYKLNCIKIGYWEYGISMSIGSTALASYTNCNDNYNNCPGTVLVSSTHTVRYTVNITWDGMNVSSGLISQSTTGDQMYQCVVQVPDQPTRIRNATIKGSKFYTWQLIFNVLYIFQFQQLLPLLLLRSTRQLPLSLPVGLHLIHLMLMDM